MKRIWSGLPAAEGVGPVGPRPVQEGGPEILIGGRSEAAMARVARWGDGYVSGGEPRHRRGSAAAHGQARSGVDGRGQAWETQVRRRYPVRRRPRARRARRRHGQQLLSRPRPSAAASPLRTSSRRRRPSRTSSRPTSRSASTSSCSASLSLTRSRWTGSLSSLRASPAPRATAAARPGTPALHTLERRTRLSAALRSLFTEHGKLWESVGCPRARRTPKPPRQLTGRSAPAPAPGPPTASPSRRWSPRRPLAFRALSGA